MRSISIIIIGMTRIGGEPEWIACNCPTSGQYINPKQMVLSMERHETIQMDDRMAGPAPAILDGACKGGI